MLGGEEKGGGGKGGTPEVGDYPASLGCPLCRARWEERAAQSLPYSLDEARVTPCDVQRRAFSSSPHPEFFFLIANKKLYCVPREWAERVHPGGLSSIASHNGKECTKDLNFHSQGAQKKWGLFLEGSSVVPCSPPSPSCTVA